MAGVRQFDESDALEKALALFWQKGFSGASMQELAAATGVQRGSLYNAYQTKEAIFLRAFNIYRERFLTQLRESLNQPKLYDALRQFFECVINSMTTGEPTRGCLTTKSAFGVEVLEEPVREVLQSLLDGLEALLLERLSRPETDVAMRISPAEAARMIVTFTRGIVVIERVYQDRERMLATADSLIRLLLGTASPNHG
jgi:TetR/AcrR family transcriptional repressor of nem operon